MPLEYYMTTQSFPGNKSGAKSNQRAATFLKYSTQLIVLLKITNENKKNSKKTPTLIYHLFIIDHNSEPFESSAALLLLLKGTLSVAAVKLLSSFHLLRQQLLTT